MPEVEAPDGSVVVCLFTAGWLSFSGELDQDEPLVSGGGAGAGGSAGGANGVGGTWAGGAPSIGPNGCSCGIDELEFWYCILFSSEKSVDVFSFKSCRQVLLRRC